MKDAVTFLFYQVAKRGAEPSLGKVREEPALDAPSVFTNPFAIKQRGKRPRLKVHRARRKNRSAYDTLDGCAVNRSISVFPNRAPVPDCVHQFHPVSPGREVQSKLHCSQIRLVTAPLHFDGLCFQSRAREQAVPGRSLYTDHVLFGFHCGSTVWFEKCRGTCVALFTHEGLQSVAAALGKQLWQIGVKRIFCTDSVRRPVDPDIDGIVTLSLAPLLASALSSFGGL